MQNEVLPKQPSRSSQMSRAFLKYITLLVIYQSKEAINQPMTNLLQRCHGLSSTESAAGGDKEPSMKHILLLAVRPMIMERSNL